jgi:GntR family colanic acid and biofilm gene transcriptional regulator
MSEKKLEKPARPRRIRMAAPRMQKFDPTAAEAVERQVYRIVRRSLMTGAILPGGKLSTRSLAEALGVSVMPVREALKRLEADGVLESRAKSAFHIHDLSQAEFREVLEIRLRLEGLAVREAAKNFDADKMRQARALDHRIHSSRTTAQRLERNFRFHFFIYQLADMSMTLALIENMWLRIGPTLNKVVSKVRPEETYAAHAHLLAALARRDPDGAERALQRDLLQAAEVIENQLSTSSADTNAIQPRVR